jgi:hypothetical protein
MAHFHLLRPVGANLVGWAAWGAARSAPGIVNTLGHACQKRAFPSGMLGILVNRLTTLTMVFGRFPAGIFTCTSAAHTATTRSRSSRTRRFGTWNARRAAVTSISLAVMRLRFLPFHCPPRLRGTLHAAVAYAELVRQAVGVQQLGAYTPVDTHELRSHLGWCGRSSPPRHQCTGRWWRRRNCALAPLPGRVGLRPPRSSGRLAAVTQVGYS